MSDRIFVVAVLALVAAFILGVGYGEKVGAEAARVACGETDD